MKISYLQFIKQRGKIITFSMLFLISSGIMLDSCIKKEDFDFTKLAGFEWSPNAALPLIHSKLTLRDVISDYDTNHLFTQNGTNFLTLIYNSTVFSQRADQIIFIPDQEKPFSAALFNSITINNVSDNKMLLI